MPSMRQIIFAYIALVVLIFAAFFALAVFADTARLQHGWIEDAAGVILDMAKIAVGAAVGSLTTAAGALSKHRGSA